MPVREMLATLQQLPKDAEVLAFEPGCEEYCEREVDEVEWQGGRGHLHLGGRRDEPARACRVEVVEAATEVNGRLAWGQPRPASAALSHSPTSWPSNSAPTSQTGRIARPTWCSPCQAAGLQVGRAVLPPGRGGDRAAR